MKLLRHAELWMLGLPCLLFGASLFYQPTGQEGVLLHNLALAAKARHETIFLLLTTAGCLVVRLLPRGNTRDGALGVEACLMTLCLFCLLLYGTGFGAAYAATALCVRERRRAEEQAAVRAC